MSASCPECGGGYTNLGMHWHHNPEHRPEIPNHLHEVITGLLMGDGNLNCGAKHPYIQVKTVSKNYLDYLDDLFGCLSTGVNLKYTAEESAEKVLESGFYDKANPDDYSDIYNLQTRTHPSLEQYKSWYGSGDKVWPEDIELTPTVLKHWFCGDGYHEPSEKSGTIKIAMSNEVDNTEKVTQLFEESGLPVPKYIISERDSGKVDCEAFFGVKKSERLWEYMGDPLPDFEYKWPNGS